MREAKYVMETGQAAIFPRLSHSLFLGFHSVAKQKGCAAIVKAATFDRELLKEILTAAEKAVGARTTNMEIKVVAEASAMPMLLQALREERIKARSCIERKSAEFRVVFFPETGQLRIEKEEKNGSLAPAPRRTRLLIVDDSRTIRRLLRSIFEPLPDFEVVGEAELPSQVDPLVKKLQPDVITMDIHMPEMDGVTLLRKLRLNVPVVMITSVSREDGPLVLNALEAGAVDYIQKPSAKELPELVPVIVEKVRTAAKARVKTTARQAHRHAVPSVFAPDENLVIAIGSSTGGTEALREVFTRLPARIPPILVVQHIPAVFSAALAHRLNELCPFEVKEAESGDPVEAGRALIAPGGRQMKVVRTSQGLRVLLTDEEPQSRHKPSVNYLFDSVAEACGARSIGVILTGMGDDGATGLLKMKKAGARTVAQSEESCVVFGMPREAIALGAAGAVDSLENIPKLLLSYSAKTKK